MMFDNNKAQETTVFTPLPTGKGSGVGLCGAGGGAFIASKKIAEPEITSAPATCVFPDFKN